MCSRRDLKTSSEAVWMGVLIWKSPSIFSPLKATGIRKEASRASDLRLACLAAKFHCLQSSRRNKVNNQYGTLHRAICMPSPCSKCLHMSLLLSPVFSLCTFCYLFPSWKKYCNWNFVFGIWPDVTLKFLLFQTLALPFPLCVCHVQVLFIQTTLYTGGDVFLSDLTHAVLFQEDFLCPPSPCLEISLCQLWAIISI